MSKKITQEEMDDDQAFFCGMIPNHFLGVKEEKPSDFTSCKMVILDLTEDSKDDNHGRTIK